MKQKIKANDTNGTTTYYNINNKICSRARVEESKTTCIFN